MSQCVDFMGNQIVLWISVYFFIGFLIALVGAAVIINQDRGKVEMGLLIISSFAFLFIWVLIVPTFVIVAFDKDRVTYDFSKAEKFKEILDFADKNYLTISVLGVFTSMVFLAGLSFQIGRYFPAN